MAAVRIPEPEVFTCCACQQYARLLASAGPFPHTGAILEPAREIWWSQIPVTGWLEALAAHPRIGDVEGLRKRFGAFADASKQEQAASAASEQEIQELAHWNKLYEERFGHLFIICARGKPASVMLAALKSRYQNSPAQELTTAAGEQMKITELRLLDLASRMGVPAESRGSAQQATERAGDKPLVSPITTHMLDTALGRPAAGVPVQLLRLHPGSAAAWEVLASSQTNADGRVPDLLPPSAEVAAGTYRIHFDTARHMRACKQAHPGFFPEVPFYPVAEVTFTVTPDQTRQHFHVPLTWNPYGYSTYRGS